MQCTWKQRFRFALTMAYRSRKTRAWEYEAKTSKARAGKQSLLKLYSFQGNGLSSTHGLGFFRDTVTSQPKKPEIRKYVQWPVRQQDEQYLCGRAVPRHHPDLRLLPRQQISFFEPRHKQLFKHHMFPITGYFRLA